MLEIKLKGPATLGNLQGPFEASIQNKHSWSSTADRLDKVVLYFGPTTLPDDVMRFQVEEFRESLEEKYADSTIAGIMSAGSSFYNWMNHFGFATTNPFYKPKVGKAYREIRILA